MERREHPNFGDSGRARWVVSEQKSQIRGGPTLTGDVYADSNLPVAEMPFNFNRKLFGDKVDHELTYQKKS